MLRMIIFLLSREIQMYTVLIQVSFVFTELRGAKLPDLLILKKGT